MKGKTMLNALATTSHQLPAPKIIFTMRGQTRSEKVLYELSTRLNGSSVTCHICASAEDLDNLFSNGRCHPDSSVAVYDCDYGVNCFSPTTRAREGQKAPPWARSIQWAVKIGHRTTATPCRTTDCVNQIKAWFCSDRFTKALTKQEYSWGPPRSQETPPSLIRLPSHTQSLLDRLNDGPDMTADITETEHALELPTGSSISHFRVLPDPLQCVNPQAFNDLATLFDRFEAACSVLTNQEDLTNELLAGVTIAEELKNAYLNPPTDHLSLRRLDLHQIDDQQVFASENDEMPGGFGSTAYYDLKYKVNQSRWQRCLEQMTAQGMLLVLVSNQRCACYLTEMQWFADHYASKFPVKLITTQDADSITINSDHVSYQGDKIDTVWRLFPTYEATGPLIDIVRAAQDGLVKLVPEFSHFCNKSWFSLFRHHLSFFQETLAPDDFAQLDQLLPDSRLVRCPADPNSTDFPCRVAGFEFGGLEALRNLPVKDHSQLVLKLTGDNPSTSRSWGVLMGRDITTDKWTEWIDERVAANQPFIIQQNVDTAILHMPVLNTWLESGEMFRCRALLRPFMYNGATLTAPAFLIPANSYRAHGRTDMALGPIDLG